MVLYVQEKQFHIDKKSIRWPAMGTMIAVVKDILQ